MWQNAHIQHRGSHGQVSSPKRCPWQERILCHTRGAAWEENALEPVKHLWKFVISSNNFQIPANRNKLQADSKAVHPPPLSNPTPSLLSSLYYPFFYFSPPLWQATLGQNFTQTGQGYMLSIKRQKKFHKIRVGRQWLDANDPHLSSSPSMYWSLKSIFQFFKRVWLSSSISTPPHLVPKQGSRVRWDEHRWRMKGMGSPAEDLLAAVSWP